MIIFLMKIFYAPLNHTYFQSIFDYTCHPSLQRAESVCVQLFNLQCIYNIHTIAIKVRYIIKLAKRMLALYVNNHFCYMLATLRFFGNKHVDMKVVYAMAVNSKYYIRSFFL